MSHEPRISAIENPGVLKEVALPKAIASTAVALGGCAFCVQYVLNAQLAWASYLQGFFYALCIGMAGAFFVAVNNVTKSVWSIPFRRMAEGMTAILPWTLFFIVPVVLGAPAIYEWTDHEASHLHGSKAAYLSWGFWAIRIVGCLVIWNVLTGGFRKISLDQDQHKQSLDTVGKSARYLIVFGFSFTIFSIDLLMSIRPHWFSTMYGVYCFAGMFQAGLCVMVLSTLFLMHFGYFDGILKKRHLFDLGTWLLAWCTFMAYIGFSQFMLIWYANLPEETPFFIDHLYEQWGILYVIVFFLKWVIPFFVLMPKPCRTSPLVLGVMSSAILFAEWLDLYWLITPEFLEESVKGIAFGPHFFLSLLVGMGFLGAFFLAFIKFMGKNNVVAVGEPNLLSSVNGDYL
jgi:hypothetical protein